jgi:hypothetical protein
MGEVLREVEQSVAFRELIRTRKPVCFLCAWIEQDLEQNKKMTGWPLDCFGKPDFPVSAKLTHVLLELGAELRDLDSVDEIAADVVRALETAKTSN